MQTGQSFQRNKETVAEILPVDIHRWIRWSSSSMALTAASFHQKRDDIHIRWSQVNRAVNVRVGSTLPERLILGLSTRKAAENQRDNLSPFEHK